MSRVARDLNARKLAKGLGQADDEGFCQLVWAIDALQSGREAAAAEVIEYAPEHVATQIIDQFHIHKWALETLVNELLVAPKAEMREGLNQRLNHKAFNGITDVYNRLFALENAEYGMTGSPANIHDEMARIGHRQFDWQRGFFNVVDTARSAYLFGGPHTRKYFADTYGLESHQLVLVGLGVFITLQNAHSMSPIVNLPDLGLTQDVFDRGLAMLAMPIAQARAEARQMRKVGGPVAYRPSVLRRKPCILFGDAPRIRAPLPGLVMARATMGVYYDVVPAGGNVTREIGERFESYSRNLLSAMLPAAEWREPVAYEAAGPKETPDILMYRDGVCGLVIECKAKRVTMAARFGGDPMEDAAAGFAEIAKGVFQTWRYFSHVRRGLIPGQAIASDAFGMVLTLDPWLQNSRHRLTLLINQAKALADKDPNILAEDRRPVSFCAIEDLEALLVRATLDSFIATAREATTPDRSGWHLESLHKSLSPAVNEDRKYPFKGYLDDYLPWWAGLGAERKKGVDV